MSINYLLVAAPLSLWRRWGALRFGLIAAQLFLRPLLLDSQLGPGRGCHRWLAARVFSAKSACVARPSNIATFTYAGLFRLDPYPNP
jgi:hypothetical protein